MVRLTYAALLTLAISASAATPSGPPLIGDPAGRKNRGRADASQFIGGDCLSDADCRSVCCAGLGRGAVCSAPLAADQAGKRGCGFSARRVSAPAPRPRQRLPVADSLLA